MPPILWSEGYGPSLTDIVLAYGHPHEVDRPLIQVMTSFAEERCHVPPLEEAIARAEHRDACFARLDWVAAGDCFDSSVPGPRMPFRDKSFDYGERLIAVDGEERPVVIASHGTHAALRFHQDSVTVTAVARLGFPPALTFHVTDDLEPYFAGYRRFVLGWLKP
jgi:hypothetical protein